jgi:hypothetical protein
MELSTLLGHFVYGLPALLVTTLVTLTSAGTLRRAWRLRHHGLVAQARVLTTTVLDTNVQWPAKRIAEVEFAAIAGRHITTTIRFRAARHGAAPGDTINVRYDPDAPEVAMIDEGERHGSREVRSSAVGIALAGLVTVLITAVLVIETATLAVASLIDR